MKKSRLLGAVCAFLSFAPALSYSNPVYISGEDVNAVLLDFNNSDIELVDDGNWAISFHENTYFNLAPQLQEQVWWGDMLVARAFADVVGEIPGVNNLGLGIGPIFLVDYNSGSNNMHWGAWSDGSRFPEGSTPFVGSQTTEILVYATAELVAVPIPPALWLFGSGLLGLIGFARRKALS